MGDSNVCIVAVTATLLFSSIITVFITEFSTDLHIGTTQTIAASRRSDLKGKTPPYPDETLHHIHWFVQVSDIHLSKYYDRQRGPDLQRFCTNSIDIIQPEIVLVTGDLTDAKHANKLGSTQYEEEWQEYHQILHNTGVTKKTVWLDVRGNHDGFNVPSLKSKENYFRKYSERGRTDLKSYQYQHKTSDGVYTFIAVDAVPDPGPKRPFNFFGVLTKDELEELEEYSVSSRSSNLTIWFGHYPMSTIGSPYPGVKHVFRSAAVYMCGHLHQLGGLVPAMYTRHRTGNLELEVGDWKDNRVYRVFAIDHDIFSFTDVSLDDWPVILVTNPKHAQFIIPDFEPLGRIKRSSHIRLLVFTPSKQVIIKVSIDGEHLGEASHSGGPLYTLAWKPELYSTGLHQLQIHALDNEGQEKTITQPFSMDGSTVSYNLIPRILLMSNFSILFKSMFAVVLMFAVLPMLGMRIKRRRPGVHIFIGDMGWLASTVHHFLDYHHHIGKNSAAFYTLLGFHIYIAIGPWFIGEIIDGHIGACFIHGIIVRGVFIPGILTYAYGVLQMITFNIPLNILVGRMLMQLQSPSKRLAWQFSVQLHLPLLILIMFQAYMAYFGFFLSYGGIAFMLCPMRTWSVIIALYLQWFLLRNAKPNLSSDTYGHVQNGFVKLVQE